MTAPNGEAGPSTGASVGPSGAAGAGYRNPFARLLDDIGQRLQDRLEGHPAQEVWHDVDCDCSICYHFAGEEVPARGPWQDEPGGGGWQ